MGSGREGLWNLFLNRGKGAVGFKAYEAELAERRTAGKLSVFMVDGNSRL